MWNDDVSRLRKTQATRLKEARILRGFSTGSDAARRYGWPVPTYNSHENGTRGIGRMYREYARKLRVNPAWLLGHSDERDSIVRGVTVVADAAVGMWREGAATLERPQMQSKVSILSSDEDDRFAVRVADASLNKVFPQGAYAICAHCEEGDTFEVGQIVYIERTRNTLTELSLRRVTAVNGATIKLSTYSVDPKARQELTMPARGGESIRIIGRVIGKYEDFTST